MPHKRFTDQWWHFLGRDSKYPQNRLNGLKTIIMSLIKTPEDGFISELEGYLDIKFDKYSLNKITTILSDYKKEVIEQNPKIITNEKIIYKYLRRSTDIVEEDFTYTDPSIILDKVSESTGLSVTEIKGKLRKYEFVVARHVSMYLIRKLSGYPLSAVGKLFNRDHSTVIYAIDHVTNMIEVQSPQYLKLIGYVNSNLEQKKSA